MDTPVAAISVTRLPATPQQRRVVFVIATLLLVAFGVAAPFGGAKLPQFVSFNPAVQSIVFVTDLITSIFLFAQYQISTSRAILALATGYLYAALIVVPYTLAYPGSFTGLLNAGPQSSAWLYYFWIDGIPLGAIAYALLIIADRDASPNQGSVRHALFWSVSLVIGLVCGITWLCTTGSWLLPPMMEGNHYNYVVTYICTPLSILIAVIAMALLWFLRESILDYWLMLVMLSLLLNHIIADFLGGERYSLGFYASRGFTIVTSTLVLTLLMKEVTNLHVRLAKSNIMLERERENKFMNIDAITGSIAHEIKQPLTAISANAKAIEAFLSSERPNLGEVQATAIDIVDDSRRISEVLNGIRGLFGKVDQQLQYVDVNRIVVEALESLRPEMMDRGVLARADLTTNLPLVSCNRSQLREVVLNLVHNAVEAMDNVATQSRMLEVTTRRHDADAILVAVKDTGPGIDPNKITDIFDAFFTTKATGMGLGLALCRAIIERHGGQLSAYSDGKNGALFQVVLPLKPADPDAVKAS
jgi:signal transduction histidine kinase